MKIYETAVRKPISTILIFVGVIVFGLFSLNNLAVDQYPDIEIPQIAVITSYAGANAADIETNITRVLEDNLNTVENLKKMTSKSSDNFSMITLEFEYGSDLTEAANDIRDAVSRTQSLLPDDVDYPTIFKFSSSMIPVMMLAVTADESYPALNKILDDKLVNDLNRINGVGSVSVMGVPEREVQVNVDPAKLEAYNLTVEQLGQIIAAENVNIPSGTIDIGNNTFNIKADGEFSDASTQLGKVVLSNRNGRKVLLNDVAEIRDTLEKATMDERVNGQLGVRVIIQKQSGANTVDIVHEVQRRLPAIAASLPGDVDIELIYEGSQEITDAIGSLSETIMYAFIFVVLVVMIFLGRWRATFIICLTIPVSLICSFIYLYAVGSTLNIISLSSLSIAIGMVVDDAIVVLENITTHIERGSQPKEAAIYATNEVWLSVIATTLVTVAIYVPIAFFGGMVGNIYMQFSVTMCVALCLSAINSLTLSPALCVLLLKRKQKKQSRFSLFRPFNASLEWARKSYIKCAGIMVRRAWLTLILLAAVLVGNWKLFETVPKSFLPPEDKGTVFCDIQLAPGATLGRTEQAMRSAEQKLMSIPGVRQVSSTSGFSFMGGNGENLGMCIAQLDPWDKRKTPELSLDSIMQKASVLCDEIPAAKATVFSPPAIMGLGLTGGVSFMLQASGEETPKDLERVTNDLLDKINKLPGTMYARSAYEANTPQLFLNIDREKAQSMHVPVSRIFTTLQSKLASMYINDFNLIGYTFKVKMQSAAEDRTTINDIMNTYIQNDQGQMVPLSSVATLSYMVGPRQISRFNQLMSAEVTAQAKPGVSSGELMNQIEAIPLPENYSITWTDMSYQERQNDGKIVLLMGMALLFGYLFLVAQYESWTVPISVIVSVSVALLGALLGLIICNTPLSIYAQLGLVMLVGLAGKNAILMVEFSKMERERGVPIQEAALEGARQRFRAVMMTAISFIIGVFPMVIASGAGAASRKAIGISTFYGMILATVVGILFIPALYAMFQRYREWVKGLFAGKAE